MDECLPFAASLEFRDSEVSQVEARGPDLVVRFAVAAVRAGAHGSDGGSRYLKGVALRLAGAHTHAADSGLVGRLSEGELWVDGRRATTIDLPMDRSGGIRLRLQFANGARLLAEGHAVRIGPQGPNQFVEHLHC